MSQNIRITHTTPVTTGAVSVIHWFWDMLLTVATFVEEEKEEEPIKYFFLIFLFRLINVSVSMDILMLLLKFS